MSGTGVTFWGLDANKLLDDDVQVIDISGSQPQQSPAVVVVLRDSPVVSMRSDAPLGRRPPLEVELSSDDDSAKDNDGDELEITEAKLGPRPTPNTRPLLQLAESGAPTAARSPQARSLLAANAGRRMRKRPPVDLTAVAPYWDDDKPLAALLPATQSAQPTRAATLGSLARAPPGGAAPRGRKALRTVVPPVVVSLVDAPDTREPIKLADMKCGICLETVVAPASTHCGHVFCFECIKLAQNANKQCPLCRKKLLSSQFHRLFF